MWQSDFVRGDEQVDVLDVVDDMLEVLVVLLEALSLLEALLDGFEVVLGSSGGESTAGGDVQSPATVTPKILMQGR